MTTEEIRNRLRSLLCLIVGNPAPLQREQAADAVINTLSTMIQYEYYQPIVVAEWNNILNSAPNGNFTYPEDKKSPIDLWKVRPELKEKLQTIAILVDVIYIHNQNEMHKPYHIRTAVAARESARHFPKLTHR